MKNKKIKSSLALLLFVLCCSVFLWNCEREFEHLHLHESADLGFTVKTLSKKELDPNLLDFVNSKTQQLYAKTSSSRQNDLETVVDFDNIIQVIDSTGNANYTFKLLVNDEDETTFYNLILHQNSSSTEPKISIHKFVSDENTLENFINSDYNFDEFTGSILKYNLSNFLASHGGYTSRSTRNIDDCPCGEVPIIGGGNPSGGSGNPIDGGPGGPISGGSGSGSGNGDPFGDCATYMYVQGCSQSNSDVWHLHDTCGAPDQATTFLPVLVCGGEPDTFLNRSTEDDCNNPCEGAGDGTVGIILPINATPDPCKDIKDLLNSNTNIKPRFKELLNNNSNNESGFQIRKNPSNGQNVPSNLKTSTSRYQTRFNYDDYTHTVAHKHPNNNTDVFELFSGHDILNIAGMANNYQGVGSNLPQTYTIFLVVNGQTFALKINDAQSLSILQRFVSTRKKRGEFHRELIEYYERDVDVTTGADSSISEQQQRLFQFLKKKEINASLSKAIYNSDNEIENWKNYNPDTNEYTTCN